MALMYDKIVDTTELGFDIRRLKNGTHVIVPLDDSDDYEEAERLAREAGLVVNEDGFVLNDQEWLSSRRFVVTASIQVVYNLSQVPGPDIWNAQRNIDTTLRIALGDLVSEGGLTANLYPLLVDDYDIVVLPGIH